MLENYLNIFLTAVFVENMALAFFLGMCTFLAVSKTVDTAIGLGIAVIAVLTLTVPVNTLERTQDRDGRWRRYVNEQLAGSYRALFAQLDLLVMLRVPDMEHVFAWRRLQERKLVEKADEAEAAMNADQLHEFIMHYERLTRFALEEMPRHADLVLDINDDHQIASMSLPAMP